MCPIGSRPAVGSTSTGVQSAPRYAAMNASRERGGAQPVVERVRRRDRRAHPGERLGHRGHRGVVEDVPGEPAPVPPRAVYVEWQVLAEARPAPCQVAGGPGQQRSGHVPQHQDAQSFSPRHPSVPSRPGGARAERGDPVVIRQQPERASPERTADHQQRTLRGRVRVGRRGEVPARPVQVVHPIPARRGRRRLADAPVIQGHHVAAACWANRRWKKPWGRPVAPAARSEARGAPTAGKRHPTRRVPSAARRSMRSGRGPAGRALDATLLIRARPARAGRRASESARQCEHPLGCAPPAGPPLGPGGTAAQRLPAFSCRRRRCRIGSV